ncbi:Copper binding protein, plastocyanin/azurin family [Methanosarcina lacustris Z-7289]|uniref:Copper binding protein, plastocyanin/azurin family n=1 Tax=Methanosarcina lacustris Z-7289 TaxID=1434111 RepID=A0A0E3WS62_9EURY|nr:hypothetical protein [Methanosarcina lacustris]AKB74155.1 Copper binding protein, plastocyanin/azurin family [Methanosarcina lacustris Z-7289]
MKIKLIVLLLVLGVVLFSGCAGNEKPSPNETVTPEDAVTPEEIVTPKEIVTPTETENPVVTESGEEDVTPGVNVTPEVNQTEEGPVVNTSGIRTAPYIVRLDNYRASPSSLDLKEGETVAWINYHDSPRRVFTLTSEEHLFEDMGLVYRRSFAYTFNETGTYNFTVIGQPRMTVNITVNKP